MLQPQEFKIVGNHPRKVKVIVKGHLRGSDQDVTMEMHNDIPANQPNNDQAAMLVFQSLSAEGGMTIKIDNEKYEFYHLSLFSHITAEFQQIQEVHLI